jgi:hypothetical protein
MMRGLLRKSLRDAIPGMVGFGIAILIAECVLTLVVPQLQQDFLDTVWAQLPFVRTMLGALLGTDLGPSISARLLQAIVFVHPVVLAILWAHEIVLCTRFPAGEIDRGTIDVLLGLPASRRAVYCSEAIVWLGSGVLLLALCAAGHLAGSAAMALEHRPPVGRVLLVMANLFGVYVASGGIAWLISSCSSRRGRAVAAVFALVLASFLLNFLAQFWAPARTVQFLGILSYYTPARVLSSGELPLRDVMILCGVGALAWAAGGDVVARRSICTV